MHTLIAVMLLAAAYVAPTWVAHWRKVPHASSVAVINFFLGWTFIGWVVALAMAVRSVPAAPPVSPPGSDVETR